MNTPGSTSFVAGAELLELLITRFSSENLSEVHNQFLFFNVVYRFFLQFSCTCKIVCKKLLSKETFCQLLLLFVSLTSLTIADAW